MEPLRSYSFLSPLTGLPFKCDISSVCIHVEMYLDEYLFKIFEEWHVQDTMFYMIAKKQALVCHLCSGQ